MDAIKNNNIHLMMITTVNLMNQNIARVWHFVVTDNVPKSTVKKRKKKKIEWRTHYFLNKEHKHSINFVLGTIVFQMVMPQLPPDVRRFSSRSGSYVIFSQFSNMIRVNGCKQSCGKMNTYLKTILTYNLFISVGWLVGWCACHFYNTLREML